MINKFSLLEFMIHPDFVHVQGPNEVPDAPGVYILFDPVGQMIYVGKGNLKNRISLHYSHNEPNPDIRELFEYMVFQQTATVEQAEMMEGKIYDEYCTAYRLPPAANHIRPPEATYGMDIDELYDRLNLKLDSVL